MAGLCGDLRHFTLSWPVYDVLSDQVFGRARADMAIQAGGPFDATYRLVAAKAVEVVEGISDEFVGGIRQYSLALVVVAAVALLTAVFWRRVIEVVRSLLRQLTVDRWIG